MGRSQIVKPYLEILANDGSDGAASLLSHRMVEVHNGEVPLC